MEREYFGQGERKNRYGCFIYSLANLLLEMEDAPMANHVLERAWNHPLYLPDEGIEILAVPKFIHDVTEGKYTGTYTGTLISILQYFLESIIHPGEEERRNIEMDAIEWGLQNKRFKTGLKLSLKSPCIVQIPRHAVVMRADGHFIDNGVVIPHTKFPVDCIESTTMLERRL